MKERYKVAGKTVQVADKGLNCARNIYAAVVEARDGIFSQNPFMEKDWVKKKSSGYFSKMMRMSIRTIGIKTESFYFA